MKKYFNTVLLFVLVLVSTTFGQIDYNEIDYGIHPMDYSPVGTVGWQFLKLHTNARSAGMAGVISPLGSGNANAAFMNPASLTDIANIDVSFNRMNWVADIAFNAISVAKNFENIGVFGLHLIYVDYGEEVRTEYSEELTPTSVIYSPVLDGLGTVGASDAALGLSFARQVTNKLHIGGNVRLLQEQIDDAKTHTWAVDIGTVFYTGYKTLRIAMLGKNFGPDAEFRNFKDRIQTVPYSVKLPMQLWLGTAMDVLETSHSNPHRVLVALDYVVPNDGDDKINLGAEYTFSSMLALRAGYRFNYDEEGLTLGGGIQYGISGMNLSIDYAYINTGIFNSVNMFSFVLKM